MTKIKNHRRTKRNRKGGSKRRQPRNTTATSSKLKGGEETKPVPTEPASTEPESDTCGICLNDMTNSKDTKKTKCGHRFHKECLLTYCKTREQQDLDTPCPFCRKNIEKDCESLRPGKQLPPNRIEDILKYEDGDAERKMRMEKFLKKLRFPKNFNEWHNITFFAAAYHAAINGKEVAAEMQQR